MAPPPQPATEPDRLTEAASITSSTDVSAALLRLAELKTAGLLTDEEFAAAKARALAE